MNFFMKNGEKLEIQNLGGVIIPFLQRKTVSGAHAYTLIT